MHRLGPRAHLVLEKTIFKSFYHTWAWRLPWSMDHDHFRKTFIPLPQGGSNLNLSNFGPEASVEKSSSVLEKKIFKGFCHIWAWWLSWSMDPDHLSNLSFPLSKEAPFEIWAKLAQGLQRRHRLKILMEKQTDSGTYRRRTKSDHYSSSCA